MTVTDPLSSWLLTTGWEFRILPGFVAAFSQRLVEAGIPVTRLRLTLRTLHPQLVGVTYTWEQGKEGIEEFEAPHSILSSEQYLKSPYAAIFDGAGGMRQRLDVPEVPLEFPILEELRAKGATDYVAMPFLFRDGQINALTMTTDRAGGFQADELERVYGALPALGRVVELHAIQRTAKTLLETYIGRHTGDRVLRGLIKRGDGEEIYAVIWFCDLRDSTALADSMQRPDFVDLLNDFFDCTAGSVLAHGGEVLRFIGDAVLAIFPMDASTAGADGPGQCLAHRQACRAAVSAAREAMERLGAMNAERARHRQPVLRAGIAMHVGEVMYGNIGVPERLEFSVIGAAANEAARLQTLCKELDQPVLASEELARMLPGIWASVGRHTLRGIAGRREIFALVEQAVNGAASGVQGHLMQ
ncbi:MAG: adenylate/guanylate cyclase domain-containing protein [Arenicellales bacterium]